MSGVFAFSAGLSGDCDKNRCETSSNPRVGRLSDRRFSSRVASSVFFGCGSKVSRPSVVTQKLVQISGYRHRIPSRSRTSKNERIPNCYVGYSLADTGPILSTKSEKTTIGWGNNTVYPNMSWLSEGASLSSGKDNSGQNVERQWQSQLPGASISPDLTAYSDYPCYRILTAIKSQPANSVNSAKPVFLPLRLREFVSKRRLQ